MNSILVYKTLKNLNPTYLLLAGSWNTPTILYALLLKNKLTYFLITSKTKKSKKIGIDVDYSKHILGEINLFFKIDVFSKSLGTGQIHFCM